MVYVACEKIYSLDLGQQIDSTCSVDSSELDVAEPRVRRMLSLWQDSEGKRDTVAL